MFSTKDTLIMRLFKCRMCFKHINLPAVRLHEEQDKNQMICTVFHYILTGQLRKIQFFIFYGIFVYLICIRQTFQMASQYFVIYGKLYPEIIIKGTGCWEF